MSLKQDIQLNDRMSSVLRDINDALDGVIEAMEQMEKTGNTAFDPSTLRQLKQATAQTASEIDELSESEEKSSESAKKSHKSHKELAEVLKTVGKAAAVGAAAVGAAAFKLGKEVVKSYADYEQLKGGVETLFGTGGRNLQEYADRIGKTTKEAKAQFDILKSAESDVLRNADNAYMTTGLSANQYIDTVTGFSASLISSLGGDTKKAAKYADDAVRAMADNANKMGTDISSIQNAYQGFAKQNYTMLDNLKLGYGGTKGEMERLLKDAEKISGMKFEMGNFADMTKAIQVIQDTMDITGTTLDEAKRTISGSINMTKAAFQNLITGLGNPDADVKQLAKNLVKSASYVIKNVTPVIENIVSVLPMAVRTVLRSIERLLPSLLDAAVNLFDSCLSMISKLLPRIAPVVTRALVSLVQKIISAAPKVLAAATQIVISLVNGISSALPDLIPLATEAVLTIGLGLVQSLPSIIAAGQSLLGGLIDGLLQALDSGTLMDTVMAIVDSIVSFLENDYDTLLQTGIEMLVKLIEGLPSAISVICSKLPQIVSSIVSALLGRADVIVRAGVDLLICLVQNAGEIISIVLRIVPQIIVALVNAFRENLGQIKQAGRDLINGLWEGLKQAWANVTGWIKNIGSGIVSTFKGIFQIHSPSRVMADIGQNIGAGLVDGITASSRDAITATETMSSGVISAMSDMSATAKIGAEYTGLTGSAFAYDGGGYNMVQAAAANAAPAGSTGSHIEIKVDMSGMQNTISSDRDLEDIVTTLANGICGKVATGMKGVVR